MVSAVVKKKGQKRDGKERDNKDDDGLSSGDDGLSSVMKKVAVRRKGSEEEGQ